MGIIERIKAFLKGRAGENSVSNQLNTYFEGQNYKLIDNLIIADNDGNTHQMDHVLICRKGIFIIETKNYSGVLYGTNKDRQWTQCVGKKKHYHYNPVKQNNGHMFRLSELLKRKFPDQRLFITPLVVLVKNNKTNIVSDNVINLEDMRNYFMKYKSKIILSTMEIEVIYNMIMTSKYRVTSNRKHNRNMKRNDRKKRK